MKIRNMIYAAVAMLSLASCSDDDFLYQDVARVRIAGPYNYAAGTDSLNFSFSTYPSETTEMTMNVDVYVMGPVADHDRKASVAVDETKTTATADMYTVPASVTIAAGQNHAVLPVTLKRTSVLADKQVRLYLKTVATDDFAVGVNEQNHFTMIWTDKVIKPANWDSSLKEFFGTFSEVKYRFMFSHADGLTEFDTDTMTWAMLQSYRIKFQNALNDYNTAHPGSPLTDENGQLVTFG